MRLPNISEKNRIKFLADQYGYLDYMIERYLDFLGYKDTEALLKANEKPLTPTIRTNTLKITTQDLKSRLIEGGFQLKSLDWFKSGFKVMKEPLNLGSLHEYLQGYFYIQSEASMIPSIVLNPLPNEVVIDMCAAPGGKSTHLAQLMENTGKLMLLERNKKRINSLIANVKRLGVYNSLILHFDAKKLPSLDLKADKILLDAPCTGEGLIREDPSRKNSKKLSDINHMADVQRSLLRAGLTSLKSGGSLLYSTCSIAPEENELVVDAILQKNPNIHIVENSGILGVEGLTEVFQKRLDPSLRHARRIYPHIHNTIGFFYCLLRKSD